MVQNYFSSPQMKWGLASGFHLPLAAAVLGAAGFVVAVIRHRQLGNLSGLLKGRREEVLLVPGLQNLGNNCFLNVILQALASCSLFQPFLQKMIEDCESDDWGDGLQLTVALASLLEDLCACGEGKVVLSPRQVMLAMAQYIRNFNLTSQQDAEEAFLHLLSSLREEFSDCYLPKQSSLSEIVDTFYSRILTPKRHETRNEKERWQQHFLGPFDGILSSTLICQTCSSQMVGCTLEDCLKRFIAAEQLENYHCSNCWHVAAVKYLRLQGALEVTHGPRSSLSATPFLFQLSAPFSQVLSSDAYMYRLVSVVEHFGRSGGGHYTVYRSARCDSPEDSVQNLHWFCVSDSQVSRVSEEDVLAAEASLLFYERIAQC
ncbi:Ubiquitin carboxyl-terminal hydrolase 27 [Linum perenne]